MAQLTRYYEARKEADGTWRISLVNQWRCVLSTIGVIYDEGHAVNIVNLLNAQLGHEVPVVEVKPPGGYHRRERPEWLPG